MEETWATAVLEHIINVLFIFDIALAFFYNYHDTFSGEIITAPKLIASRYLRGLFMVDFLSTFPFRQLGQVFSIGSHAYYQSATIVKILKVIRLTRVFKIIARLNLRKEIKAQIRVFFVLLTLVLYTHWIACLLWFAFRQKKGWYPVVDFMYVKTSIFDEGLPGGGTLNQYLTMMYCSVLTFSAVEIAPRSVLEIFCVCCVILVSAMVNAQIFGIFANLAEELTMR